MHAPTRAPCLRLAALGLGLVLSTGCNSLQYVETDELLVRSDTAFDLGRYPEAIEVYDELLRRNEQDGNSRLMRGVSHERSGDEYAALEDYAAVQGDPRGLLYRANLNIRRGAFADAEQDLARLRAASLGPREQVIQLVLVGTLRLEQGDDRMALQSFERAIEEGASYEDGSMRRHKGDAHYNASRACYRLGDFHRAYEHYLAYARSSSGRDAGFGPPSVTSPEDAYMLAVLAYLAGDFDAADVHAAQADPALVAQAQEVFDDPGFGSSRRTSHRTGEEIQ